MLALRPVEANCVALRVLKAGSEQVRAAAAPARGRQAALLAAQAGDLAGGTGSKPHPGGVGDALKGRHSDEGDFSDSSSDEGGFSDSRFEDGGGSDGSSGDGLESTSDEQGDSTYFTSSDEESSSSEEEERGMARNLQAKGVREGAAAGGGLPAAADRPPLAGVPCGQPAVRRPCRTSRPARVPHLRARWGPLPGAHRFNTPLPSPSCSWGSSCCSCPRHSHVRPARSLGVQGGVPLGQQQRALYHPCGGGCWGRQRRTLCL
jgi:hypothetical protein